MKMLRNLFNYLNDEKGMRVGSFHKCFYARNEEVPILVLSPEQLNFPIYDKLFEESLSTRLQCTRDIFVFGCTVALRVSDLLNLNGSNLEISDGSYYLKVISKKAQALTRIKLPVFPREIINRSHRKRHQNLLPVISNYKLNKNLKLMAETAGWTDCVVKTSGSPGNFSISGKNCENRNGFALLRFSYISFYVKDCYYYMLSLGHPFPLNRA